MTVYFIGAGPGDPELLTLKAKRIIEKADVIVYAGSLINPEILEFAKKCPDLYDSSAMALEEIVEVIGKAVERDKTVARLHSGDPGIYGATGEQIRRLEKEGASCEIVPGVSSFLAASALLGKEYTVPGGSQTIILTRLKGRTPVPKREKLRELAKHRASMCIFLSVHMIEEVVRELKYGYSDDTPAAIVYRSSWNDEKVLVTTIDALQKKVREMGIKKTALILVGRFLDPQGGRSRLYDKEFKHGYRGKP
ncbi:MAG: precorrin-4 C(11)-methyltransferase [Candidatus Hydrothermarchaeaceae archaeon]